MSSALNSAVRRAPGKRSKILASIFSEQCRYPKQLLKSLRGESVKVTFLKINRNGSIKVAKTRDAAGGRLFTIQALVASSADRVELSEVSAVLKRVEEALKQVSVVDTTRVEAMMQSIHEGRFMFDSALAADRMVAAVREHLLLHNHQ